MPSMNVGDLSSFFFSTRATGRLKTAMTTLSQEISTGQTADLVARMGGDTARLVHIDRRLSLIDSHTQAGQETAQALSAMQTALNGLESERRILFGQLLTENGNPARMDSVAEQAESSFTAMVRRLNTWSTGKPLFAGTAHEGSALAAPEAMLADLGAAVAGATGVADLIQRVDNWFDLPTGGFATMGYLGDTGMMKRSTGEGQSLTLDARADDPALRDALRATALATFADHPAVAGNTDAGSALMETVIGRLATSAAEIAGVTSRLGAIEARNAEAMTRLTAERSALTITRNQTAAADPFETASRLQEVTQQLERHYVVTARLSQLTLADYLR